VSVLTIARNFGADIVNPCPAFYTIIPIQLEARGNAMLNKKCLGAVILAATVVSSTAMADDRGVNTAVGAVIGAAIGHNTGGRNGAIVGGVLGAAVGNSISRNDRSYNNGGYYDNRSNGYYDNRSNGYVDTRASYYDNRDSYYQSAPVYVQESRPVYYQPQPTYYYTQPSEVVYVSGGGGYYDGYRGRHGHGRHGYGRHDYGYDR
jgi:hypothetical protein